MIPAVVGILFVVVGYQPRYRKRYWLIAGYDARTTKNPEPIARIVFGTLLAIVIGSVRLRGQSKLS